MLLPILAIFARISKPLWLNIRSKGAEVTSRQKTFSNGCSSSNASLPQVPRPRPRPRLEDSKTTTKTKTLEIQLPRPRPRRRLVETGLETSRDQDASVENSKSAPYGRSDLLHFKYIRFDSNFLVGNKYFVTSTSTSTSTEGSSTSTSTSTLHASTSTSTSTRKMYLSTT